MTMTSETSETSETSVKTILQTCDNWDTDYNSSNWEPEFMTIFVTWQSRVTLDSIRNSCDVFFDTVKVWRTYVRWIYIAEIVLIKPNLTQIHFSELLGGEAQWEKNTLHNCFGDDWLRITSAIHEDLWKDGNTKQVVAQSLPKEQVHKARKMRGNFRVKNSWYTAPDVCNDNT